MTAEMLLKTAVNLLGTCHVFGADAEKFGAAIKNINMVVKTIEKAKKEVEDNDHHDK